MTDITPELDNISSIKVIVKSPSPATIPNPTTASAGQSERSCAFIRNKKFIYSSVCIILISAAILIPMVLVFKKKMKVDTGTTTTTTAAVEENASLYNSSIMNNTKWRQNGITVAEGNSFIPTGIYIDDDDDTIYTTEYLNHRVTAWKYNTTHGRVVAGGNGQGYATNQLQYPTTVTVDKRNNSIIICDLGNRRVIRWSRQNAANGDIIIYNIDCYGVATDNEGYLYVADHYKSEVRRWTIGVYHGSIVAGGYRAGNDIRQLHSPTYIFVDAKYSVYVSDLYNNRITKWIKGAEECMVVAGGQGDGIGITQLSFPAGIVVDQLGNVYVVDQYNHRIMRWIKGATQGSIVVGGNGKGNSSNQLTFPQDLSFDKYGNLYVTDGNNNRVQKFYINSN